MISNAKLADGRCRNRMHIKATTTKESLDQTTTPLTTGTGLCSRCNCLPDSETSATPTRRTELGTRLAMSANLVLPPFPSMGAGLL